MWSSLQSLLIPHHSRSNMDHTAQCCFLENWRRMLTQCSCCRLLLGFSFLSFLLGICPQSTVSLLLKTKYKRMCLLWLGWNQEVLEDEFFSNSLLWLEFQVKLVVAVKRKEMVSVLHLGRCSPFSKFSLNLHFVFSQGHSMSLVTLKTLDI